MKTGHMIKTLKWPKNSFLCTYNLINNIPQALIFLLGTPVLNLLKHFVYKLIFYFLRSSLKEMSSNCCDQI